MGDNVECLLKLEVQRLIKNDFHGHCFFERFWIITSGPGDLFGWAACSHFCSSFGVYFQVIFNVGSFLFPKYPSPVWLFNKYP